MKKLVFLVLIVLIGIPAFSQIKFGIKAGVSTNTLSMPSLKNINGAYTVDALSQAEYGFHGGIFLRMTLLGIYLQPELLFSTRSNEYKITNLQSTASYISKQQFNKMDIPVLLGFKLGPIRLNAGPVGTLLLNSPKDLITDNNYKSMYSRMTIGYQAGLGFDLLKTLTFDIRYEGNLKKYQNQIENLTGTKFNLDDRVNAFLFSVGLMF
jgi:hypothetical protein